MDATYGLAWRPDCGCGAEWTPCVSEDDVQIVDVGRNGRQCGDEGGVQNWDVGRNGRHVLEWAASRLEM